MPELPEVETFRRKLEKSLRGKSVEEVFVHPDKLIFNGKSSASVKKVFLHARIKNCYRKGKYIWFELGAGPWPVFHLGMTGSYEITKELPDKKQKSVKLVLRMSDGTVMIFKDPRRFGRIFLLDDPLAQKPLILLGPDVFTDLPSAKVLQELLSHHKAPIKAVLLDQTVLAGIGNWVSDEVLFQSKINPHRPAADLSFLEIKKLHAKIKSVTKLAVKVGVNSEKYPKRWIFHRRWGKKSDEKIKHDTVGGRTTAWIPEVQV